MKKIKILILSDINTSTEKIVQNGLNLAKILDGEIDFFCVKKPTDIVKKESQLSVMRTINEKFLEADNQIKKLITEINNDNSISIHHQVSFGNLKDEIGNRIKETKPDLIILGNKNSKILSFLGDNILELVLKEHEGTVMIASDKITLEASSELSLGLLNDANLISTNNYQNSIVSYAKKPLISFQVNSDKVTLQDKNSKPKNIIQFVFENGDNALASMSKYMSKNNVQLLFVNREINKTKEVKYKFDNLANELNCSIMLTH